MKRFHFKNFTSGTKRGPNPTISFLLDWLTSPLDLVVVGTRLSIKHVCSGCISIPRQKKGIDNPVQRSMHTALLHYSRPPQQISSSIPQNLCASMEAVPWHLAGACGLLGFVERRIIRPVTHRYGTHIHMYASLGKGHSRLCPQCRPSFIAVQS